MNPKAIKQLANQHGWRFVGQWPEQPILEFKKMADKVLVNYEKCRVTTIVYHDKFKGRFGATSLRWCVSYPVRLRLFRSWNQFAI